MEKSKNSLFTGAMSPGKKIPGRQVIHPYIDRYGQNG